MPHFRMQWPDEAVTIQFEESYFRPHPYLGFTARPGSRDITIIRDNGERYVFGIGANAEGYRLTGTPGPLASDEVWIFGCSATFGWSVNDHETMPWLLQERFPELVIKNYAGSGFGTVHAVLQLRELLRDHRPRAAIVTYNAFHCERNVAAPRWLRGFDIHREALAGAMHPRAGFKPDGVLYIRHVPLYDPHLHEIDGRLLDPDRWYAAEVTIRLFEIIENVFAAAGCPWILAAQSVDSTDRVYESLAERSVRRLDIVTPYTTEWTNAPFDLHPNAKAHKYWADRLEPTLREALA